METVIFLVIAVAVGYLVSLRGTEGGLSYGALGRSPPLCGTQRGRLKNGARGPADSPSGKLPAPLPPATADVEALSTRWGRECTGYRRKVVWAELAL